jgi:hypothetical protein
MKLGKYKVIKVNGEHWDDRIELIGEHGFCVLDISYNERTKKLTVTQQIKRVNNEEIIDFKLME